MIFYCETCEAKKELHKIKTVYKDGQWITLEAYCEKCKTYMKSKPLEGFPDLIRTEPSLKK
tara:strand:- start:12448 stop:12630 length:183 start_codon:yes stop_codon:yes gene_type:complete